MGPRADFECTKCGEATGLTGVAIIYEDLSITTKFCPECGTKAGEGFERLFNAVNVMSGNTRETGKLVEDKLAPLYAEHSDIKSSAQRFERGSKEAMEKTYEKAAPAQRRVMTEITHEAVPVTQTGFPNMKSYVHDRPFGMPITRHVVPLIEKRK